MKFQITVLFALVAAAAAAKLPIDQYKQQAMAAKNTAENKMSAAVNNAQQMLKENNIDFDVQSQVDSAIQALQKNIEAQNYQAQAEQMAQTAKQQMNKALEGIENQTLRNNLSNLFKNLQSEGKKMAERNF